MSADTSSPPDVQARQTQTAGTMSEQPSSSNQTDTASATVAAVQLQPATPSPAASRSITPPPTPSSSLPLNGKWTFWYDNPRLAPQGSPWKDNLKNCGSFDNIEAFWRIYNNCKPPSQLSLNSNYHIFRKGILPTWEDPVNVNGGKFVYTMQKKESRTGICDERWLLTVLAVIGETLDIDGDQVVGGVVSIRKTQDRISLWIKSADKGVCTQIGCRWKKALEIFDVPLKYQVHKDAAETGRSFRNEIQFSV